MIQLSVGIGSYLQDHLLTGNLHMSRGRFCETPSKKKKKKKKEKEIKKGLKKCKKNTQH